MFIKLKHQLMMNQCKNLASHVFIPARIFLLPLYSAQTLRELPTPVTVLRVVSMLQVQVKQLEVLSTGLVGAKWVRLVNGLINGLMVLRHIHRIKVILPIFCVDNI